MNDFCQKDLGALIKEQIRPVVKNEKILTAFNKIKRHWFIPKEYQNQAYEDEPVSIGYNQTTSQPSLIGYMLSLLKLNKNKRILEIGTGSGFQTALLSQLVKKVYSIEIIPQLAKEAQKRLIKIGCKNVEIIIKDGSEGLKEKSPFDGIVVTAVASEIPQTLIDQLNENGILVIPVSKQGNEILMMGIKKKGKFFPKECMSVHFVPLLGKFGFE